MQASYPQCPWKAFALEIIRPELNGFFQFWNGKMTGADTASIHSVEEILFNMITIVKAVVDVRGKDLPEPFVYVSIISWS